MVGLLFGGLILSVVLCAMVLDRPAPLFKDPVWWVMAPMMTLGPPILLEWYLSKRHRGKRLSIDQEEVCFGSSSVRLTDLKSISTGQFQGFMERNFSTLEKAAVIASNPITASHTIKGAQAGRQKLRDYSLTLTKQDGKQIHWIGALAYFQEEDIKAFFQTLLERKPDLELQAKPSDA
ncbi:hypothetical protein ACYFX5_00505 [Bremerella sp. T1]|uniref:hypothetical protein n=1 Tax=Bremerella sp. TYQ1 TaxID=3119568 RepID=UPI001CCD9E19|nr:hypothetical protein [Bremerella volcania]UBM36771.1 hypothetical protein LA756_02465 [Bremerella volcania]